MTPLKDALEALWNAAQRPGVTPEELYPLAQSLYDQARKVPCKVSEAEVIPALARGILLPDAAVAGLLATLVGALLENGCAPGPAQQALLQRLEALALQGAPLVPEPAEETEEETVEASEEEPAEDPELPAELHEVLEAIEALWRPGIALFSVSPQARLQARAFQPQLETLSRFSEGAHWLSKIIPVLHEEPVVVIEPSTRLGIEGKLSGVVDNFQLHVLLMEVFPHKGLFKRRRVPRKVVEVARGQGPQQLEEGTVGVWNMCTHQALQPDLTLSTNGDHWVWGEGIPQDIPLLDGKRVILLGPPSYQRSWNTMRMFSALPADLQVTRQLSGPEVQAWMDRILQARA